MSVLVNAMRTETEIREEIEALRNLPTAQLKEKYREVFGEETRSNHKQFLFRRIAWRIQADDWGGLYEQTAKPALGMMAANAVSAMVPAFRIGSLYHIQDWCRVWYSNADGNGAQDHRRSAAGAPGEGAACERRRHHADCP